MSIQIPGLDDLVEVGRGGFATVYRAYQPDFRRTVAVKVLHATDADEATRERFRRECQAMGLLSEHPSIVTVLDAGFLPDGHAYLVMPYMPAGSLADRVRTDGALTWAEASRIVVKVAGALHAAHDAGVIHRDIKPANILVSEYGEPKLGDFGIARVLGGHETKSGVVTASVPYAAPEIVDGAAPTVATDVYSLGATAYALLSGAPPFEPDPDTSMAGLLRRVLVEEPTDLRSRGVPAPVADVVMRALAKRPGDRQETAALLGREMRLAQDELGVRPTELTIVKIAHPTDDPPRATRDDPEHSELRPTVGATVDNPAASPTGPDADATNDLDDATNDLDVAPTTTGTTPAPTSHRGRNIIIAGGVAAAAIAVTAVLLLTADDDAPTTAASPSTTIADEASDDETGVELDESPQDAEERPVDGIVSPEDLCPDGLERPDSIDFSNLIIEGSRFECLDLTGADFTRARMDNVRFVGVDLTDATFAEAQTSSYGGDPIWATGVRLGGARFSGANINLAIERSDVRDLVVSGASHIALSFIDSNLDGADLTGGWASPADELEQAPLNVTSSSARDIVAPDQRVVATDSDLSGAQLAGASVTALDSLLVGADLTDVVVTGELHRTDLTDARVDGISVESDNAYADTTCPDGTLSNANFGRCDL